MNAIASPTLTLPLRACFVSPLNPRKHFDPEALAQLAETIAAQGVLQPILVRPARDPQADIEGPRFEVVNGARRVKAAGMLVADRRLPLDYQIPAVVRDMDDAAMLLAMGVENLARADMTPLEEADYFAALKAAGRKEAEIARDLGVGERTVWRRLSLLHLVPAAREALAAGDITQEVATALTRLPAAAQEELLDEEDLDEAMVRERIRAEEAREKMVRVANAFMKVLKPGMYVRTGAGSGPYLVESVDVQAADDIDIDVCPLLADLRQDRTPGRVRRLHGLRLDGARITSAFSGEIIVISAEEARRLAAGRDADEDEDAGEEDEGDEDEGDEDEGDEDEDDAGDDEAAPAEGLNRQDTRTPSAPAPSGWAAPAPDVAPRPGTAAAIHARRRELRPLLLDNPSVARAAQLVQFLGDIDMLDADLQAEVHARLRALDCRLRPLLELDESFDVADAILGTEAGGWNNGLLNDREGEALVFRALLALEDKERARLVLPFAIPSIDGELVGWNGPTPLCQTVLDTIASLGSATRDPRAQGDGEAIGTASAGVRPEGGASEESPPS